MKEHISLNTSSIDFIEIVILENEEYFKLSNVDNMSTFFMSIVSDSNHWMFIASNGGLTAGRTNADYALFPYYTEDKIKDNAEYVGSKTIIQGMQNDELNNWEPFSIRSQQFTIERNLYKHRLGNAIIFEEINHDLKLRFAYTWSTSDIYGFVKKSVLHNLSDHPRDIRILDGLQNIMPANVGNDLQNMFSNLVNAYKFSELHQQSGLGIFALSARITDRAEPSEALFANTVWSIGIQNPIILLSTNQLDAFRKGMSLHTECENKGDRGAYFVSTSLSLDAHQEISWKCIADVQKSQSDTIQLIDSILNNENIETDIVQDIQLGSAQLCEKISSVDGMQYTNDPLIDSRHYSNVLFNAMRGGVFTNNYTIDSKDFLRYVDECNRPLSKTIREQLNGLADICTIDDIHGLVETIDNISFTRIALEYLPLTFSRRHGDPSRPWNKFSINTKNPDGSLKYDYQGNWRDIFQNWEALSYSYPLFVEGMIRKFLNASTFDGYNPYRVLKNGFDWEIIEHDNPWSYIGYWGDHQIIYLLKLLEVLRDTQPDKLQSLLTMQGFAYAHIPYTIKPYEEIIANPKSTIDFDHDTHSEIVNKMHGIGSDGALLTTVNGEIHHVNFIEKILATLIARLANYVPEGGIWMNTQRPEWNDANNALVGNGISMVTLYYLHRFILFMKDILSKHDGTSYSISYELSSYLLSMAEIFNKYDPLSITMDDKTRRSIMDELGEHAASYRKRIYDTSFSGEKAYVTNAEILQFLDDVLQHVQLSIQKNKRSDGLYHAYNLLTLHADMASIAYLPEMLEGQVAALNSGIVSTEEAIDILDAMRSGALYREDQNSFMLYPIKTVPGFLQRNTIPKEQVESSTLLMKLIKNGNTDIIQKDIHGAYHFAGELKNMREYQSALNELDEHYHEVLHSEFSQLLTLYESVFHHKAFTGRSGTFFAYEGIGSIYWHMVSKLRYVVQEILIKAVLEKEDIQIIQKLLNHYTQICDGIGVHKSPKDYGAFPIDPYSHTPLGKGAQQPGMTGQVKEDVICRMRELGVLYISGEIHFTPTIIKSDAFLKTSKNIMYYDLFGVQQEIHIPSQSLFFTICQVPVIITLGKNNEMKIFKNDGTIEISERLTLNASQSKSIFSRNGLIQKMHLIVDNSRTM